MRTFEQYFTNMTTPNIREIYDDMEKLFLELTYFNELEIRFDFIEYDDELYYYYKETKMFMVYEYFEQFYINERTFRQFVDEYVLNIMSPKDFISDMIEKHLNLINYSIRNL